MCPASGSVRLTRFCVLRLSFLICLPASFAVFPSGGAPAHAVLPPRKCPAAPRTNWDSPISPPALPRLGRRWPSHRWNLWPPAACRSANSQCTVAIHLETAAGTPYERLAYFTEAERSCCGPASSQIGPAPETIAEPHQSGPTARSDVWRGYRTEIPPAVISPVSPGRWADGRTGGCTGVGIPHIQT